LVKSYIVRIYSSSKKFSSNFVGTVETVSSKQKKAFSNADELWKILSSTVNEPKPSKTRKKR
jgi:hypothetical protein